MKERPGPPRRTIWLSSLISAVVVSLGVFTEPAGAEAAPLSSHQSARADTLHRGPQPRFAAAPPVVVPPGPPGKPAIISVLDGDRQSSLPGAPFGAPFRVRVEDRVGRPVPNSAVSFSTPEAGATGSFPGSLREVTARTDSRGIATSPKLVADSLVGTYAVTAAIVGLKASTVFAATNTTLGYRLLTSTGEVIGVGAADVPGLRFKATPAAVAASRRTAALWSLDTSGHVVGANGAHTYGDARLQAGEAAVGIALTPSERGYWILTNTGRVLAMGDASRLTPKGVGGPAVALASDPSAPGLWIARADGSVMAFGAASGSVAAGHGAPPPVAIGSATGGSAVELTADGQVHPLGSGAGIPPAPLRVAAATTDSLPHAAGARPVAIALTRTGRGYWLFWSDGVVAAAGDAPQLGNVQLRQASVVAAVAVPLKAATGSNGPRVPARTKVLGGQALAGAIVTPGGTVTLDARHAPSIKAGDVIVAGSTALTPHGLLRRVVSAEHVGNRLTLSTSQASLPEAEPDFSFSVSTPLAPSHAPGAEKDLVKGVRNLVHPKASGSSGNIGVGPFDIYVCNSGTNYAIQTSTCPSGTTQVGHVNAGMTITPSTDFGLSCNIILQCQAHATGTLSEDAQSTANFDQKVAFSKSIDLFTYNFDPIPIDIGPFVVIVLPQFTLTLNLGASIEVKASFSVEQMASASAGLTYDNGTLTPFSSFSNTFHPPTFSGGIKASANASLIPKLNFEIDDLAGAYVSAEGKIELDVDTTMTPWWQLYLEADIHVGLDLTRIFGSDAKQDVTVYDQKFPIASASTPPVSITSLPPPDPVPGKKYSYTLSASGGSGTLTWSPETLSDGLTLNAQGVLSGTAQAGVTTFTATVMDPSGALDERTYQLERTDTFSYTNLVKQDPHLVDWYRLDDPCTASYCPVSGKQCTATPPATCAAIDQGPNRANGTYSASPAPVQYHVQGAILGDLDSAVNLGGATVTVNTNTGGFPSGSAPRTLEVWVNSTACCNGDNPWHLIGYSGLDVNFFHSNGSYYLQAAGSSGPPVNIPYFFTDGAWHLMDVTYDGANVQAYLDGQPQGPAQPLAVNTPPASNLTIGAFPGSYDEAALYSINLSPAVVANHWTAGGSREAYTNGCTAVPTAGYGATVVADKPALYYRLNDLGLDASDRVAYDFSGHCHNAALPSSVTADLGGVVTYESGAAVSLNGSTVTANSSTLPATSASRTLEVWVSSIACCNGDNPWHLIGYDGFQLNFLHSNGSYYLQVVGSGGPPLNIPFFFSDGAWHLIDVELAGGKVTAYLDAANRGTFPLSTTSAPSGGELVIGGLPGNYDEAAVYSTALSPTRVNAHFAAGSSPTPCSSVPTSGYGATVVADSPAAYYRLGDLGPNPFSPIAFDSSGNCINADYPGDAEVTTPGAILQGDDGAMSTTGGAVSASSKRLPSGTSARTFELWVDSTACCNGDNPWSLIGYGGLAINFLHSNGSYYLQAVGSSGPPLNIPFFFTDGAWHLIDVTYANGTFIAYRDGAAIGTGRLAASTSSALGGLFIGGLPGLYDEAAIYPAALSSQQIAAHWTAGASSASACATSPSAGYAAVVMADSPTSYYRLGDQVVDASSRVAYDSSGHCHNAGYPSILNPIDKGALLTSDDGAEGLYGPAVVSSAAWLPGGASARTLEVWVNSGACCNGDNPWHLIGYNGLDIYFLHSNGGYYLQAVGSSGPPLNIAFFFSDGAWHLIDVSFDGTTVIAYRDGAAIGAGGLTVNSTTSGMPFVVGGGYPAAYDEAAVYPSVLSPQRIAAHWTPGASTSTTACLTAPTSGYAGQVSSDLPVAYYRLGDKQADETDRVAFDSSGACHNGAYTTGASGYSPGALSVGDDGGAQLQGPAMQASAAWLPKGAHARTLEVWVNSGACCNGDNAWHLIGYNGLDIYFLHSNGSYYLQAVDEANTPAPIQYFFSDGAWHLIDITYDGSTVTAYRDGVAIGSAPLEVSSTTSGTPFVVGGGYPAAYDEAAVYPGVLSAGRIQAHYKAGAFGRFTPLPPRHLTASPGSSAGTINLAWNAPTDSGSTAITNYKVYRSQSGGPFTLIASVSGATLSYPDSGLPSGTPVRYEVTAVNSIGESAASNIATATPS
jgi:Concanavalin A-like lectin/glucanases superfamily/Fibronectin type III domain